MIVDDDPLILQVVSTVLDLEEFDVVTATTGEQALQDLPGAGAALVVTDVMMPDMDGFELCDRIRRDPVTKALPVILLTARDSSEDRTRGGEVGADAYLTKPFSPLELIEAIDGLLAGEGAA